MTLLPGLKGNGIFFRYLNYVGLTNSFKLFYSFTKKAKTETKPKPNQKTTVKTFWDSKFGSLCKSLLSQTGVTMTK